MSREDAYGRGLVLAKTEASQPIPTSMIDPRSVAADHRPGETPSPGHRFLNDRYGSIPAGRDNPIQSLPSSRAPSGEGLDLPFDGERLGNHRAYSGLSSQMLGPIVPQSIS